jgi:DNA-damage-inducible protein D
VVVLGDRHCSSLIQQPDYQTARKYWNKLKQRLDKEGSQLVTNCHRLKLEAADGKKYLTDVATAETLLRLVQSVPSPKAEPIKLWLAKVGFERMQEMADPSLGLDRAREIWRQHGRSEKWIQQRMMGQETRNKLTDYWKDHDIKEGEEFAILTNIIHQEWSGVTVKDHKTIKGLKTQNLRDHNLSRLSGMTEAELIFTALAEMSTRQIAETEQAVGMPKNKVAARKGGGIAKKARLELEQRTGKSVVTGSNFLAAREEEDRPEEAHEEVMISARNISNFGFQPVTSRHQLNAAVGGDPVGDGSSPTGMEHGQPVTDRNRLDRSPQLVTDRYQLRVGYKL